VERSFADAKQLHGYRYARFRGKNKVEEQCLMTALVQNIKKLAKLSEYFDPNNLFSFFIQFINKLFSFREPNLIYDTNSYKI
jgi:hypothetical protein